MHAYKTHMNTCRLHRVSLISSTAHTQSCQYSGSVEVNWTQPVSVPPQTELTVTTQHHLYQQSQCLHYHVTTCDYTSSEWKHTHTHDHQWSRVKHLLHLLCVSMHTLNWAPVRVCVTLSSQEVYLLSKQRLKYNHQSICGLHSVNSIYSCTTDIWTTPIIVQGAWSMNIINF